MTDPLNNINLRPLLMHEDARVGVALSVEMLAKFAGSLQNAKRAQAAKTLMEAAQALAQMSGVSSDQAMASMRALALKIQKEVVEEAESEAEPISSLVDTGDTGVESDSEPAA